jgi:hypothetical protein
MGAAEVATWMPSCFSLSAAKARSFCNLLDDGHNKQQSLAHRKLRLILRKINYHPLHSAEALTMGPGPKSQRLIAMRNFGLVSHKYFLV